MMQIYDDAIKNSKKEYRVVVVKALETRNCKLDKKLLEYLEDGYEVSGVFFDNMEYNAYSINDINDIKMIARYFRLRSEKITSVKIEFTTIYDYAHSIIEETGIAYFMFDDNKLYAKKIFSENDIKAITEIIFRLGTKQDKEEIIEFIKKEKDYEIC